MEWNFRKKFNTSDSNFAKFKLALQGFFIGKLVDLKNKRCMFIMLEKFLDNSLAINNNKVVNLNFKKKFLKRFFDGN